jgi:hypothetical protein
MLSVPNVNHLPGRCQTQVPLYPLFDVSSQRTKTKRGTSKRSSPAERNGPLPVGLLDNGMAPRILVSTQRLIGALRALETAKWRNPSRLFRLRSREPTRSVDRLGGQARRALSTQGWHSLVINMQLSPVLQTPHPNPPNGVNPRLTV